MGELLLGNGAVNRLCQKYRLCFVLGPCRVDIRESNSEAGDVEELRKENETENGAVVTDRD
jgi:hypothetical protein